MSKPAVEMAFELQPQRAVGAIRWTRDDITRMEEIGILPEKYELLDGDIISKMGQGLPHRRAVSSLNRWLQEAWGWDSVQSQASVDVSPEDHPTNRPEPDLAALNRPMASLTGDPGPGSIDLLIEVSDSTLADDLTKKAGLYARAGIPEYWIFDASSQRMHIHRKPSGGRYLEILEHIGQAEISPLARPEHKIRVDAVLA